LPFSLSNQSLFGDRSVFSLAHRFSGVCAWHQHSQTVETVSDVSGIPSTTALKHGANDKKSD
jgi:hypothetical protein